jgi:hypothetical protein
MNADKLERVARAQAKVLKSTLELYSEVEYLDSDGRQLLGELYRWLEHTKPLRSAPARTAQESIYAGMEVSKALGY